MSIELIMSVGDGFINVMWRLQGNCILYSNPPDFPVPIYHVPRYTVPVHVPPMANIVFYNKKFVNFPPIYHAPDLTYILLSPKKQGKSGDYCKLIYFIIRYMKSYYKFAGA